MVTDVLAVVTFEGRPEFRPQLPLLVILLQLLQVLFLVLVVIVSLLIPLHT